ncbi:MAG: oligosaccharide flippase family protein [Rhodobacteraceae bacterium]|nr:oligosaccharide flippase family protein [Paracoccaceae bacterium]
MQQRWIPWAVPIWAEIAALGRSVVFAWIIGADQLGQAMMLALVVRLTEMASDLGVDRLLLQAPDGNSARFQAELQGVALIRGLVGAAVLAVLAPALAGLFPGGPNTLTYLSLAIVPLFRGLAHLDFRRAERRFRYRLLALVEGGATAAMAVLVAPAALVLGDHRAMVVVLIAHAVSYSALSHIVASRGFRLRFSRTAMLRVWSFGAPLVLNAGLLFLTFYADRLIVARAFDWATLALYGVTLQLALLPAQIVGRAAGSLVLPRLREALRQRNLLAVWQPVVNLHAGLALVVTCGFILLAPILIDVIYGSAFRPDLMLALAIGVAAGFRVLRTPYSQLAVATGRTGDPARANLLRAAALVPAAGFAAAGLPLAAIGAAAALGEAAATLRAVHLAHHSFDQSFSNEVTA